VRARRGAAGAARRGVAGLGVAWLGRRGAARRGEARRGAAGRGGAGVDSNGRTGVMGSSDNFPNKSGVVTKKTNRRKQNE